jgi:hypothetical protein
MYIMENDARDFIAVKETTDEVLKYTYLVSCRFRLLTMINSVNSFQKNNLCYTQVIKIFENKI